MAGAAAGEAPATDEASAPLSVLLQSPVDLSSSHRVCLAGSFNDWKPAEVHGSGTVAVIDLPVGAFEYKWVVDGKWLPEGDERSNLHVVVSPYSVGFRNDDARCFLNSAVQGFFALRSVRDAVLHATWRRGDPHDPTDEADAGAGAGCDGRDGGSRAPSPLLVTAAEDASLLEGLRHAFVDMDRRFGPGHAHPLHHAAIEAGIVEADVPDDPGLLVSRIMVALMSCPASIAPALSSVGRDAGVMHVGEMALRASTVESFEGSGAADTRAAPAADVERGDGSRGAADLGSHGFASDAAVSTVAAEPLDWRRSIIESDAAPYFVLSVLSMQLEWRAQELDGPCTLATLWNALWRPQAPAVPHGTWRLRQLVDADPPPVLVLHVGADDLDLDFLRSTDFTFTERVALHVGSGLCVYSVVSVVAKSGDAAGGHYVAACLSRLDESAAGGAREWWLVDDTSVSRLPVTTADSTSGGAVGDAPIFREYAPILYFLEFDHVVDARGLAAAATAGVP